MFLLALTERKRIDDQRKQDWETGQRIQQTLIHWSRRALTNPITDAHGNLQLKSVQVTPLTSDPQNLTLSLQLLITFFQSTNPNQNSSFFVSCTPTHTQTLFHCQTYSAVYQTHASAHIKCNTFTLKCRVDCSCHSNVKIHQNEQHPPTLGDLAVSILLFSTHNQQWEAKMVGRIPLPSFESFITPTDPILHIYPITSPNKETSNVMFEYRNPRILVLDTSSSPTTDPHNYWIQSLQSKLHSTMDIHFSRQQQPQPNYDSRTANKIVLSLFANSPIQRLGRNAPCQ